MIHLLCPLAIIGVTAMTILLGEHAGKSSRVLLGGGLTFPLLTLCFVVSWAGGLLLSLRQRPRPLRLFLAPIAWLSFGLWAILTCIYPGPTSRSWAYAAAWFTFPLCAIQLARRSPVTPEVSQIWTWSLGLLATTCLFSPSGLHLLPANINLGAMLLLPAVPLSLALARRSKAWLHLAIAVAVLTLFLLMGRRTALLASAGMLALSAVSISGNRRARLLTLGPAVGSFALLLLDLLDPQALGPLAQLIDSVANAYSLDSHSSDLRRARLTHQALDVFVEHPIMGVGFGRYLSHLRELGISSYHVARPHNIILITLAETGAIGACLLVAAILAPAWRAWQLSDPASLGRAWVIAYVGVSIYLLGNDYIHSPGFWPVFAAMVSTCFVVPPCRRGHR